MSDELLVSTTDAVATVTLHRPAALNALTPTMLEALDATLAALDADRDFLRAGDVFTDSMIDGYLELKQEEVDYLNATTHPVEFDMYYSV